MPLAGRLRYHSERPPCWRPGRYDNVAIDQSTRRILTVCLYKSKSESVIWLILAIFSMTALTCKAYAQQGVSGTLTAGTGSSAYLQFLGAPTNPQIACALNAGSDCSILFTPMGAGGLNFQNGHGGNSL